MQCAGIGPSATQHMSILGAVCNSCADEVVAALGPPGFDDVVFGPGPHTLTVDLAPLAVTPEALYLYTRFNVRDTFR